MSGNLIALILDILVLGFLGATIVFVYRLSESLKEFKKHRREFDGVIADLLSSIDQAERSVQTLKNVGAKESAELERLIDQSRSLADELKIINETGENMAKRLEKLAEENRKAAQNMQARPMTDPPKGRLRGGQEHKRSSFSREDQKISSPVHARQDDQKRMGSGAYGETLKKAEKKDVVNEEDFPSFMIQDREFADLNSLESKLDASASNDASAYEEDEEMPEHLQSEAEKELFAALRKSRRNVSGGGRS